MGMNTWDANSSKTYATMSSVAKSSRSATDYFKSEQLHLSLNPKNVDIRESVDSDNNPESTAIIVALDVTGSMGFIAHALAKAGLGRLIEGIIDTRPVSDPHIMFQAIGDVKYDMSPLQVSQFETDIQIAQQLNLIHVEQGGGGNNSESYHLPWYFAANHTEIDCFEKRGQKGFLFTVGDELPPPDLTLSDVTKVMGNTSRVQGNMSCAELLSQVSERYEVFHLIAEEGSYCTRNYHKVCDAWGGLLGNRALKMKDHSHMPEIIIAAIEIAQGADLNDILSQCKSDDIRSSLTHAFSQ